MNKVQLHIANSAGTLDKYTSIIKREFEITLKFAKETINAHDVDVIFTDRPSCTVPELGIGGHALTDKLIIISIDTAKKIERVEWKATLLHELHHCMRYKLVNYDVNSATLLDTLILEGLATHYEGKSIGKVPLYAQVATSSKNVDQASKLFDSKNYVFDDWLFGDGKNIPRWFGYSLGYRIVDMASKDLGKSAAEMVGYKTEIFRPYAEKI